MPGMSESKNSKLTLVKKGGKEDNKNKSEQMNELFAREGHLTVQRKSNISEESYNLFINKDEIPENLRSFIGKIAWKKWNNKQRLEWHLEQIAEGHPFTYEYTN